MRNARWTWGGHREMEQRIRPQDWPIIEGGESGWIQKFYPRSQTFSRRARKTRGQRELACAKPIGGTGMNRLQINRILALVLPLVGAMAILTVATLYETCETPTTDTAHHSADAKANGGKSDNVSSHCLIYGKYCLGKYLHGR
jgi:hypothetical protein